MNDNVVSLNRQSIRLHGYDYSIPGYYFVTIVCQNRLPVFGDIKQGEMQLNPRGIIIEHTWLEIPLHFPFVTLDEYVIMPNHLHGIVTIKDNKIEGVMGKESILQERASTMITTIRTSNPKGPKSHSLSAIIGSFKSATTKRLHKKGLIEEKSIWQRNYYDHIIRDDEDYLRIIEYIQTNPINWEKDEEFLSPPHPS